MWKFSNPWKCLRGSRPIENGIAKCHLPKHSELAHRYILEDVWGLVQLQDLMEQRQQSLPGFDQQLVHILARLLLDLTDPR